MTDTEQLEQDIAEWTNLKEWMAIAKARESYLRQSIALRAFSSIKLPSGAFPEGTKTVRFEGTVNNYASKLVSTWNREVLEELIIPTLQEARLSPDEQKGLIHMNPKLSVAAYKALPSAKRSIVDKMLNVKQGPIQLEVNVLPK